MSGVKPKLKTPQLVQQQGHQQPQGQGHQQLQQQGHQQLQQQGLQPSMMYNAQMTGQQMPSQGMYQQHMAGQQVPSQGGYQQQSMSGQQMPSQGGYYVQQPQYGNMMMPQPQIMMPQQQMIHPQQMPQHQMPHGQMIQNPQPQMSHSESTQIPNIDHLDAEDRLELATTLLRSIESVSPDSKAGEAMRVLYAGMVTNGSQLNGISKEILCEQLNYLLHDQDSKKLKDQDFVCATLSMVAQKDIVNVNFDEWKEYAPYNELMKKFPPLLPAREDFMVCRLDSTGCNDFNDRNGPGCMCSIHYDRSNGNRNSRSHKIYSLTEVTTTGQVVRYKKHMCAKSSKPAERRRHQHRDYTPSPPPSDRQPSDDKNNRKRSKSTDRKRKSTTAEDETIEPKGKTNDDDAKTEEANKDSTPKESGDKKTGQD
jgi:hypothetical protein